MNEIISYYSSWEHDNVGHRMPTTFSNEGRKAGFELDLTGCYLIRNRTARYMFAPMIM